MKQFVQNLLSTVEDAARQASLQTRGRPRARRLLAALRNKRRILVTCHRYPDPDALGSAAALLYLLRAKLPPVGTDNPQPPRIEMRVRGDAGTGINSAFTKYARFDLLPWDDALFDPANAEGYDAVVLCDVQPSFPYSPLPTEGPGANDNRFPTAIVDHHRSRGPQPKAAFVDIRIDMGATASIVFSYFMELDVDIPPDLAAIMLYAIESDLAGAAGQPSDLDNAAMSALNLRADTRRLYRMRHVALPQHYFVSYANGLANAQIFERVLITHLGLISSLEKPAVIADFLLRYEGVDWAVVTALAGNEGCEKPNRLIFSVRVGKLDVSAGDVLRRALHGLGEGGGHRTKAGGQIRLENGTTTEIERVRLDLRRRLFLALKVPIKTRGRRLIEVENAALEPSQGADSVPD